MPVGLAPGHCDLVADCIDVVQAAIAQTVALTQPLQGSQHTVCIATVVPDLLFPRLIQECAGFLAQRINQLKQLPDQFVRQFVRQLRHSRMRVSSGGAEDYQPRYPQTKRCGELVMGLNLKQIGGMRLTLVGLSLLSLPMVFFADMEPHGIGVMTAYIIPSLVVLFFFVLMLDALMNRVFMIEQDAETQGIRRRRMWLDLVAGIGLLIIWGSYFRTLLQM